ncbi:troponin C, isoallergen Bla g 6.0101-like isoform X2 [Phlebotomus argentipes]|nr:troponin C, isoallergen Bla g 6.0101-like isoform X2 [Phlebotomus argentipes]
MELLDEETLKILQNAFKAFDTDNSVLTDDIGTILEMLGHKLDDQSLKTLIRTHDPRRTGKLNFEQFCALAGVYVDIEEDQDAIREELREAFLLYDKERLGYLTTEVLRDILHELDDKISDEDLDMMIDEIDADGSGTVDFEEFMEVMTG